MIILGIDTSCDETALAILRMNKGKLEILSNVISSQIEIHRKYGGVYPTLAKREHQRNLVPVLKEALLKAKLLKLKTKNQKLKIQQTKSQKLGDILKKEEVLYGKLKEFLEKYQKPKIDLIAVTTGPGLEPCLWQGINFAKALAFWWNLPIVGVNHIEGHIFANFIDRNSKFQLPSSKQITNSNDQNSKQLLFPAVCLVVSGGHTQLILMKKIGKYKIIGETRDDAAGECFDKTARILGLSYPGGPAIAQQAERGKFQTPNPKFQIRLPLPMINSKDYDFSFSGLKTAVLYEFKKQSQKKRISKQYIKEMAKEIQQAIIDVLIKKTIKAAKNYKVKSILLGGGVAANKELRKQFKREVKKEVPKLLFIIPKPKFCTDNAVMIAVTGYFHRKKASKNWQKIVADANLKIG